MTSRALVACMLLLPVCALLPARPTAGAGAARPAKAFASASSPGAARPAKAAAASRARAFPREAPFVERAFRLFIGERWIGEAIAYGPHRDGQHPGSPGPSRAELREDLQLMSKHWSLLRVYGSVGWPDTLLEIIRGDGIPMKVLLGAWIAREELRDSTGKVIERFPAAKAANQAEVEGAVRLAAAYPEIVLAVSVGNETQVTWSSHTCAPELLVKYLREVRARTTVPVTTADDFAFWKSPASQPIAKEVDFVFVNLHPLWNGRPLGDAVPWTRRTIAEVQATHVGRLIVIGETGWATQRSHEGEQARLIKGETGEAQQATFRDALTAWTRADSIATFFFEAFDENWKGGPEPDEVEKHWGLFRANRTPKLALRGED